LHFVRSSRMIQILSIWEWLLNPAGLTAHGFCLSWAPGLIALHAGADAVVGLSYFSIPVALAWFVRQRLDLHSHFRWTIYLFVAFILACGTTHLFSILTLWVPAYGVEGLVKAVTAVLSIVTAAALWPLVPRLLALPSPNQMRDLNVELSARIASQDASTVLLRESEVNIRVINAELEQRVIERTSALQNANTAMIAVLEQRQQLIERLTISNEERTHFVIAASHDLREPLRMVTIFCGRLSSDYGDRLDKRGSEYMSLAIKAAAQMIRLLDDLVNFGRLDSAHGRESWFDANEGLNRVLDNLEEPIQLSGARITHNSLPKIFGNPIRFYRVLENIVGNALKYVAPDVSPCIHVSATRDGEFWLFSVSDNGIGIDQRHFQRIFEPFKRLHDRSLYNGTGLGLAICRRIVSEFGGSLSVRSAEGEGSTFSFSTRIRDEALV
jgi:signal transduction histidine kinase